MIWAVEFLSFEDADRGSNTSYVIITLPTSRGLLALALISSAATFSTNRRGFSRARKKVELLRPHWPAKLGFYLMNS